MIAITAPAAIHGDALTDELRAAGLDVRLVALLGDVLQLDGLNESDRKAAQAVVDAHVPPAPAPDPQEAFAAAVNAATTIAELKAALLGSGDRPAMAAAKGKPQP